MMEKISGCCFKRPKKKMSSAPQIFTPVPEDNMMEISEQAKLYSFVSEISDSKSQMINKFRRTYIPIKKEPGDILLPVSPAA